MGNLIGRAAALADLPIPLAATPAGRDDSGSEEPFATTLVNSDAVRIDGRGRHRNYDRAGRVFGLHGPRRSSPSPAP